MSVLETLWHNDPAVARVLMSEARRQRDGLELIASENYTSRAVLDAQGSVLTNKYVEGYHGQLYHFVAYGIDPKTELIDYDQVAAIAAKERPKMITVGASAYSRAIDFAIFRQIADSVGAFLFADIAHPAGLIAKGLLPSPVPHAHVVTSTTHKTLRGPRGGLILMGEDYENPFGKKAAKSGRTLIDRK